MFQETLTGFKWMGNKAYDLKQQGKTVIFAFEEAIGTTQYLTLRGLDTSSLKVQQALKCVKATPLM